MNEENGSLKVFKMVEYIKRQEFPFDTHDEIGDVLDYFKVGDDLTVEEQSVLTWELGRLAERAQNCEIARLVIGETEESEEACRGWEHGC